MNFSRKLAMRDLATHTLELNFWLIAIYTYQFEKIIIFLNRPVF